MTSQLRTAVAGAVVVAVLAGGCSTHRPPAPPAPAPVPSVSDGAQALLEAAVGGVLTGNPRVLGGGYGALRRDISNTLAETPPGGGSVSFLFVCSGSATVTIRLFRAARQELTGAGGAYTCNDQPFQRAIEVPRPTALSFEATVSGEIDGTFGYAYVRN